MRTRFACAIAALSLPAVAVSQQPSPTPIPSRDTGWVGTWGAAPSASTNNFQFAGSAYNGNNAFNDQTMRLIVHTSISGSRVRVRLSNEFGAAALNIGAAHIALSDGANGIIAGTDTVLTFNGGSPTVSIPPSAPVLSDPVKFDVPATTDLAISIFLPDSVTVTTAAPTAQQTSYVAPAQSGDNTGTATLPLDPNTPTITQWPILAGVEIRNPTARTFVILGSSVSLAVLSTPNANTRWCDDLAKRLNHHEIPVGVVNASIVANHLYTNGNGNGALARLDRDALARPGIAYAFINDVLGVECQSAASPDLVINGLRQMIERVHSRGIKLYAGTILPLGGSTLYSDQFETNRQAVNAFIRNGGTDGYVDFDAALRDPNNNNIILAAYDGGDHHHPNDAGNHVMAATFDLALFQ